MAMPPSFKKFMASRKSGGVKKGVNLLAALKKAKLAKKGSKADMAEDKKDNGADESKENS